jgi:hypothetical protein
LGGLGGSALGSLVGMSSAGQGFGSDLGASLSKWLGSGDYTVQSNIIATKAASGIPMMHNTNQSIVVRHREYIADVISPATASAFAVQLTYALNPGVVASFPWLSAVAAQFQEYTIRGLVYHYVPTSGQSVSSTSTALGSVIMATNYRATAPSYASKVQMLNEYFSNDARPSEAFCHPIECNPKENPYNVQYVRTGPVPSGEDSKTYDLGTFYVAVQGHVATSDPLGELWATYEVELRKPILTSYLDLDAPIAHLAGTGTSSSTPFSAFTKPIDTFLGGLSVSGLVITIPSGNPGRYMYAMGSGSSLTQATWGTFTYTNARQLNMNAAGANSAVFNDACSAITQSANSSTVYMAVFDVLDASQATTITISYGTVAGSLSHSDFYIARISSSGTAY